MKKNCLILFGIVLLVASLFISSPSIVEANHSWGGYHWARTANPFSLKLGDNLTNAWDPYLVTAATDWSQSNVLDLAIVPGLTTARRCKPTSGRIEVCNDRYGNNGWLGIAQIWISGTHITQAITKMNDTYFNTPSYNTPAWKRLVVCQEVAHAFGLDHQDENFGNANLGSCMDYTNNPSGPPSNEHPNAHDFEEISIIYAHLDSFTTLNQSKAQIAQYLGKMMPETLGDTPGEWGKSIRDNGKVAVFEREFGAGQKVVTFVIWATE